MLEQLPSLCRTGMFTPRVVCGGIRARDEDERDMTYRGLIAVAVQKELCGRLMKPITGEEGLLEQRGTILKKERKDGERNPKKHGKGGGGGIEMQSQDIVTKKIGEVNFLAPALLGDILEIWGRDIKRGRTSLSMEGRVVVRRAHEQGEKMIPICECTILFVAIDEKGKPCVWNKV